MKFDQIIEHLAKRGFVTRTSWKGKVTLFFGMDNAAWTANVGFLNYGGRHSAVWKPCLAEIVADDWEIINCFWGEKTGDDKWDTNNFKPWDLKLIEPQV